MSFSSGPGLRTGPGTRSSSCVAKKFLPGVDDAAVFKGLCVADGALVRDPLDDLLGGLVGRHLVLFQLIFFLL